VERSHLRLLGVVRSAVGARTLCRRGEARSMVDTRRSRDIDHTGVGAYKHTVSSMLEQTNIRRRSITVSHALTLDSGRVV